jgi:hypothetical protein
MWWEVLLTTSPQDGVEEPHPETYSLHFVGDSLELKNQLQEYACRGEALEGECYLKVFLDTYDAPFVPETDAARVEENGQRTSLRQRPRHERIPYLPTYGNSKRCRVRRAANHETLPRFIGRWFPRSNDATTKELYCASMLLLLKPWRTLADLKTDHQTFSEVFASMMATAPEWVHTLVENVQNYYDCADQAKADETDSENSMSYSAPIDEDLRQQFDIVMPHEIDPIAGLTEQDVELAHQHRHSGRERQFLNMAMMVAQNAGIHEPQAHDLTIEPIARQTVPEMLATISEWETDLKAITREHGGELTRAVEISNTAVVLEATTLGDPILSRSGGVEEVAAPATPKPAGRLKDLLNAEQRRAHDIIIGVVENDLKGS